MVAVLVSRPLLRYRRKHGITVRQRTYIRILWGLDYSCLFRRGRGAHLANGWPSFTMVGFFETPRLHTVYSSGASRGVAPSLARLGKVADAVRYGAKEEKVVAGLEPTSRASQP